MKRKVRTRKRLSGTEGKPRLHIFRSLNHIYAQVVDDDKGVTLVAASTLTKELKDDLNGKKKAEKAAQVGKFLAEKCKEKDIEKVVFDRSGYRYHGRVKALADGAREGGLSF